MCAKAVTLANGARAFQASEMEREGCDASEMEREPFRRAKRGAKESRESQRIT